jgi:hypothetical protein
VCVLKRRFHLPVLSIVSMLPVEWHLLEAAGDALYGLEVGRHNVLAVHAVALIEACRGLLVHLSTCDAVVKVKIRLATYASSFLNGVGVRVRVRPGLQ